MDMEDEEATLARVHKGTPPYLNPMYRRRSFIEGRLVEIMNKCHKLVPEERADIFEIVRLLKLTKVEAQHKQGLAVGKHGQ